MGWTSTGDPYANVGDAGLVFESKEAAIAFATKHGWPYFVSSPVLPLGIEDSTAFLILCMRATMRMLTSFASLPPKPSLQYASTKGWLSV